MSTKKIKESKKTIVAATFFLYNNNRLYYNINKEVLPCLLKKPR